TDSYSCETTSAACIAMGGCLPELREARARTVEVLGLEHFHPNHLVATYQADPHVHRLEGAALAQGAEIAGNTEDAVRPGGDRVQGFDGDVGCLLEERGHRSEVLVAVQPPEPSTPMVDQDEVVGQHGAVAVHIVRVECAQRFAERCRGARRVAFV